MPVVWLKASLSPPLTVQRLVFVSNQLMETDNSVADYEIFTEMTSRILFLK